MPDRTGKIGPHKLVWPAFWAHLKDQQVTPIAPQIVKEAVGNILYHKLELPESATWPELTEEMIAQVLGVLASENSDDSRVVYICGGKLHRIDGNGNLITSEHQAAKAYAWPIAHNVRPAAQSLGVRGCEDCHAADAPFYFGQVNIDSAVGSAAGEYVIMHQLHGADSDVYKPVTKFFKWLIIIIMTLLILHILGDLFRRALSSKAD